MSNRDTLDNSSSSPETPHEDQPTSNPEQAPRRRFLSGVAGVLGGTAVTAMGAYGLSAGANSEAKNRILQRIKQDIARDQLEDALGYDKGSVGHDKYFTCG